MGSYQSGRASGRVRFRDGLDDMERGALYLAAGLFVVGAVMLVCTVGPALVWGPR